MEQSLSVNFSTSRLPDDAVVIVNDVKDLVLRISCRYFHSMAFWIAWERFASPYFRSETELLGRLLLPRLVSLALSFEFASLEVNRVRFGLSR